MKVAELRSILCLLPITEEVGMKEQKLLFVDSKNMLVSNTSIFEEQNLVDVFLLENV